MQTKSYIIKTALFTILLLLITNKINASNIATDTIRTDKYLSIGYWGKFDSDFGTKIGIGKTYLQSSKYSVHGSLSILISKIPDIYTSAGIILNNSLRITGKKGLYFEHGLNYGYLGSYYDFDFYRTNSNGEIVNVGQKWVSSVIVGYSLGLGYDFSKKTNTNIQLYVKPEIYYRFPNNDNIFYLNNYSVEMGLIFHPKWLGNKN